MAKQSINNFLVDYNKVVKIAFDKTYMELDPKFKGFAFAFNSGFVETVDFPITKFLSNIELFDGTRKHHTPADAFKFTVTNKVYDDSVDIDRMKMKRAAASASIIGLDMYTKQIESMGRAMKEHPYELMLDMLEAGDASTYGLTFDGQNFFDTTHSYDTAAGSQSNLLAGTGATTTALLSADLTSAMSAMNGFFYVQGAGSANSKKRKLNKEIKPTVVCPSELWGLFRDLQQSSQIANNSNIWQNAFELVSRPMTDANDWYLLNDASDISGKPFIVQTEEAATLDMPSENDDSVKEHNVYTFGARRSGATAYGAWWGAIQVTNS